MADYVTQRTIAVCSISMNMTDRIRLIGVPGQLVNGLRQSILSGWGRPIQDERNYHGAHEFKLSGNPWHGAGADAVLARNLINSVLLFMAKAGWNLVQAADISKKAGDKDTMFFESSEPDPDAQLFALSFNMGDRIRVIGANGMMPYVKKTVENYWPRGIQNEREYNGSLELKLAGNPWWADGSDTVSARSLLNQILATLRSLGFKLYGSIDISLGHEGRDLESWFFRRVGPYWS